VFKLSFDAKNKLLVASASGVYSSDDVAALDAEVLRLVAREGPLRGILDLTAVDAVAISDYRLAIRGQQPSMIPGNNRVFVAPQPEINRLCRDFASLQRVAGSGEPRVVTTLKEAYAALGITDPQFEPVEELSAG
jgi:hypothetical protein